MQKTKRSQSVINIFSSQFCEKQIHIEIIIKKDENKKSVVLVEYPRKGVWAVGFATRENTTEMASKTNQKLLNVLRTQPRLTTQWKYKSICGYLFIET